MTNEHPTPRPDAAGHPDIDVTQARRDRRRRTIYASLAGWALLGAASTGIVACGSAATTSSAGAAATTAATTAAGTSAAGTAASTAPASTAASSAAAPASTAASSAAAPASTAASSAAAPAESSESAAAETSEAAAAGTYADGSYTATGTYQSPGGQESVTITLTIAGDTITEASGEGGATQPPSSQYQGEFLDNFAAQIVGKNIDEVSLSKVAGSSLTSGGFNQALETIKSDARA